MARKYQNEQLNVWFKTPTTDERVKRLENEYISLHSKFENFSNNIFFLNSLLVVNAFILALIFIAVLNV